jgi:N-acetylmuramidase-like protein
VKQDQPTSAAYAAAAWMLDCDEAAIRAVAEVEAGPHGAFFDSGEPVILYEPHVFSRLTKGKFNGNRAAGLPDAYNLLSYPAWKPGTYGPMSAQHARLQAAAKLDREAALKSCSWGLFQIMGENHLDAGFSTVQRMVTAAYDSADAHLRMFVNFIMSDAGQHDALKEHDWKMFARRYNGPGYWKNQYDVKIAAAYARLT